MNSTNTHNRKIEFLKEYVKQYVDLETLLLSLGFQIYRNTESELRGPCFLHGGDNKTGFLLKKTSKRFYCFTKNCHYDESGSVDNDLIALVRKAKHCSFMEALSYLASLCGMSVDEDGVDDNLMEKIITDKEQAAFSSTCSSVDMVDGSNVGMDFVLDAYTKGSPYFKSVGIDNTTIDRFMLGTYVDNYGNTRASVPVWDDVGTLVGYSGRATCEDYNEKGIPKYDIGKGLKKAKILYNLNNSKFPSAEKNIIIIVEGFKAVWHLLSCGFDNVAAVMGSSITEDQVLLLVKYNINNVILFLDWDAAGAKGTIPSLDLLKKYSITTNIIPEMHDLYKGCKQPDDFSCKELHEIIGLYMER